MLRSRDIKRAGIVGEVAGGAALPRSRGQPATTTTTAGLLMTTNLTHGAHTEQLREISTVLAELARAVDAVDAQGSAHLKTLAQAWSGQDSEIFAANWQSLRPHLTATAGAVQLLAAQLVAQAEQQERASRGSGRTPLSSSPGASPPAAREPAA